MERRHSDDDWRELGEHLWRAHLELLQSYAKASEMWGNKENVPWEIRQIHGAVGRLRVKLDAEYHREKKERSFGFPDPIFGAHHRVRAREVPSE